MADDFGVSSVEGVRKDERREMGRLEALSDGVFAVAVTLLIFGVTVPTRNELTVGKTLLDLMFGDFRWLSMVTYAISFLTILVMWVNHHSVFQYIARIDRVFVYLNGALLMLVVFVNYPTALVAEFANTSGAAVAAATYSAVLSVMACCYNGMWLWAARDHHLLANDIDPNEMARITFQYRFGPLLYLAAFGLTFVSPWLSIGLNAALALYFAFTGQITRKRATQGQY